MGEPSSSEAIRRAIAQVDEAIDNVLVPVVRTLREGVTAVYGGVATLPSLASEAVTVADGLAQTAAESTCNHAPCLRI